MRDKYDVPHITAETDDALTWTAGWVIAEDRGLLLEEARYNSRLAAIDAPNLDAIGLIASVRTFTPSAQTETEVARQTRVDPRGGPRGRRLLHDIDTYVKGINAQLRASNERGEAVDAHRRLRPNALKGQFLGQGGGDEARRSEFLAGLQQRARAPERPARLRRPPPARPRRPPDHDRRNVPLRDGAEEQGRDMVRRPELAAAVAVHGRRRHVGPRARGASLRTESPTATAAHASNILHASRASARSNGHPLFVGGPQIGYFYPGLTLEMDLHGAGHRRARRDLPAPFPGYMLIGRGAGLRVER